MAIERRRPDLAAALLRAGADPFLMPAGVHHLLPLPVSPGLATAADRALAALLEVGKLGDRRGPWGRGQPSKTFNTHTSST